MERQFYLALAIATFSLPVGTIGFAWELTETTKPDSDKSLKSKPRARVVVIIESGLGTAETTIRSWVNSSWSIADILVGDPPPAETNDAALVIRIKRNKDQESQNIKYLSTPGDTKTKATPYKIVTADVVYTIFYSDLLTGKLVKLGSGSAAGSTSNLTEGATTLQAADGRPFDPNDVTGRSISTTEFKLSNKSRDQLLAEARSSAVTQMLHGLSDPENHVFSEGLLPRLGNYEMPVDKGRSHIPGGFKPTEVSLDGDEVIYRLKVKNPLALEIDLRAMVSIEPPKVLAAPPPPQLAASILTLAGGESSTIKIAVPRSRYRGLEASDSKAVIQQTLQTLKTSSRLKLQPAVSFNPPLVLGRKPEDAPTPNAMLTPEQLQQIFKAIGDFRMSHTGMPKNLEELRAKSGEIDKLLRESSEKVPAVKLFEATLRYWEKADVDGLLLGVVSDKREKTDATFERRPSDPFLILYTNGDMRVLSRTELLALERRTTEYFVRKGRAPASAPFGGFGGFGGFQKR